MTDRRRELLLTRALDGFAPNSLVGAWMYSSATAGDVASVPDLINPGNPLIQGTSARRPTAQVDSSLQFNTNDVLVWPLIPAINGTHNFLWAGWVKHDGAAAAAECYFAIEDLTNGASAKKLSFVRHSNGALRVDAYTDGTNARRFTTTATFGADPMFVMLEFCAAQTGEANQLVVSVDTVIQAGSFSSIGTPAALSGGLTPSVTGNMCVGNRRDTTVASSPLNGRLARNQFCGSSGPMAGVTQGLLTAQARTNLFNFVPLT